MRDILKKIPIRTPPAPQKLFVTYVRTLQWWRSRLRGIDAENEPVHIPATEIENRFFIRPTFTRKDEISKLCKEGEISVSKKTTSKGREMYLYSALKPGEVNLGLLDRRYEDDELDELHTTMRNNLMKVDLPQDAPRTKFFENFLQFREERPDLFFKVDDFSKRVHTPVSNFKKEYRPNILLDGHETTSLDVQTMQPLLLGKILYKHIGKNEFSEWIESGQDVYIILQKKAKLKTRDEGKTRFFQILFSRANKQLSELFGRANWIEWINEYKSRILDANPKSLEKNHSNLAWLLSCTEVEIMQKVWAQLASEDIPFLSVHDEIIIRKPDEDRAFQICHEVFSKEFNFFRINRKQDEQAPRDPFDDLETYLNGLRFDGGILTNEYGYPASLDTTPGYKFIDDKTKTIVQMIEINPSLLEFHQRFYITEIP